MTASPHLPPRPHGALARAVRRAAGALALPAAITLLGEKGWRVRRRRSSRPIPAEARA
jgi:hypothetical protein